MPSEWPLCRLGKVARVRSGYAFKSSGWTDTGIAVVKIANVKNGRLEMTQPSRVSKDVAAVADAYRLSSGDILIGMTGYIGEVARVRESDLPCLLNQRVGRFSVKQPELLDRDYLYYVLRSEDTKSTIEGLGYGSAQANISPALLESLQIPLPSLRQQQAIACILGSLDDKIELNRRMNETLEGIARAIFKSWFVDFDPVRAKAEGRDTGLPAEIADLFPSSFVDSELGEIPEGWGVEPILHFGNVICGKTPPTRAPENYGASLPFVTIPDMHGKVFVTATARSLSEQGATTQSSKTIPPFSVCVSCIATVGLVALTSAYCQTNQQINTVVPSDSRSWAYLYFALQQTAQQLHAHSSGGSVVSNLNKSDFGRLPLFSPSDALVAAFHDLAGPFMVKVLKAQRQSSTVTALHDTLLPKLISGELRVPDAERIVGRCA